MSEYNDTPESEIKKSKYNSAIAQLYRLDNLWKDAHSHSRDINYIKWNEDLDRIWMELISDAKKFKKGKDGEPDELGDLEIIEKFNEALEDSGFYHLSVNMKIELPILYAKLRSLHKKILMKKETHLRNLMNKQGKGTAYEDSIDDYMDDF